MKLKFLPNVKIMNLVYLLFHCRRKKRIEFIAMQRRLKEGSGIFSL